MEVISGQGLGLLETIAVGKEAVDGKGAPLGQANININVNAATGNVVMQTRDEVLVSAGIDADLIRTYNSLGSFADSGQTSLPFFNFHQSIKNLTGTLNSSGSTVTMVYGDGHQAIFSWNGAQNAYVGTDGAGAHDVLTFAESASNTVGNTVTTSGIWTFVDGSSRATLTFTREEKRAGGVITWQSSQLIGLRDAAGKGINLVWSGSLLTEVRDAQGTTAQNSQKLMLGYDDNNRVRYICAVSAGITTTGTWYEYDAAGRLAKVITDLTPEDNSAIQDNTDIVDRYETSYTYDGSSQRIASITQTDGSIATFAYDNLSGRILRYTQGTGANAIVTEFDYIAAGQTEVKTVASGQSLTTKVYSNPVTGRLNSIEYPVTAAGRIATVYSYDGNSNNVSKVITKNLTSNASYITSYTYDANGNVLTETSPEGRVLQRTWDSSNQLTTVTTSANGADADVARYYYNNSGQLIYTIDAAGAVTEIRYETVSGNERISTLNYLEKFSGEANAEIIAIWLEDKAAISRKDDVLDFRGQLQKTIIYGTLDKSNNGILDGKQSTTNYVYDLHGRLIKCINPRSVAANTQSAFYNVDNKEVHYAYDGMGRLLAQVDSNGYVITHRYLANFIETAYSNGLLITRVFNNAGQLIGESRQETANAPGMANIKRIFNDGANFRNYIVNGNGDVTVLQFDVNGNTTHQAVIENGILVSSLKDVKKVDDVIRLLGAVKFSALSDADFADNGQGAGKVVNALSGRITRNSYDAAGRLIRTTDAGGAVSYYWYNSRGQMIAKLNALNALTVYSYNTISKTISQTSFDTRLAKSQVDILLEVDAIDSEEAINAIVSAEGFINPAADRTTGSVYDKDGNLRFVVDAEGYVSRFSYDKKGQLIQSVHFNNTPLAAAQCRSLVALQNIAGLDDFLDSSQSELVSNNRVSRFFYDAAGHKTGELDAEGYLTEFTRNSMDELLVVRRYAARVTAYNNAGVLINANKVLTASLTDLRPLVSYTDEVVHYVYNSKGLKLATVRLAGEALNSAANSVTSQFAYVTEYKYDASGNQVQIISYNNALDKTRYDALVLQLKINSGHLSAAEWALKKPAASSTKDQLVLQTFDDMNRLLTVTDIHGAVTRIDYDGMGQIVHKQTMLSNVERREVYTEYNDFGDVESVSQGEDVKLAVKQSSTLDSTGRLVSSKDQSGNITRYYYNALGQLLYHLNAAGEITRYSYNVFGERLARRQMSRRIDFNALPAGITLAGGLLTAEVASYLDSFSVVSNDIYQRQTYTRLGQVDKVFDANNQSAGYGFASIDNDYNAFGEINTITRAVRLNSNAVSATTRSTRYSFDRRGLIVQTDTVTAAATMNANITTIDKRDAFGRVINHVDANGNRVSFSYNSLGQQLMQVKASGTLNITDISRWDAFGRQIEVTKGNQITAYSYDDRANTLTITSPQGIQTRTVYNAWGQITRQELLGSIDQVLGRWIYDHSGHIKKFTNSLGNSETSTYDESGMLVALIDSNNVTTQYSYDKTNRIVKVVSDTAANGLKLTNEYQFDAFGRRVLAIQRDNVNGDRLTYTEYDANGNVKRVITDPGANASCLNLLTEFSYDLENRQILEKHGCLKNVTVNSDQGFPVFSGAVDFSSSNGSAKTYTYNDIGRLVKTVIDPGGLNITTQFTHDGNGNVIRITNANGEITHQVFDGDNRVVYTFEPAGTGKLAVTFFRYDANGNVVEKVRYMNTVSQPANINLVAGESYFGNVLPVTITSSDWHEYAFFDKDNRQLVTIDAAGLVRRNIYNDINKVYRKTRFSLSQAQLAINPATITLSSLLLKLDNNVSPENVTEIYFYDDAGNLTYAVDGMGYVTHTLYDTAGHVIEVMRCAEVMVTADNIDSITLPELAMKVATSQSSADNVIRYRYDAAGRLTHVVDAELYVTESRYDASGNIVQTLRYAVPSSRPDDWDGVAVSSAGANNTYYIYDSASRLLAEINTLKEVTAYHYDALGNRTLERKFGKLFTGVINNANIKTFITTMAIRQDNDRLHEWKFDAARRVLESSRGDTSTAGAFTKIRYSYDALGNLLMRVDAANSAAEKTVSFYRYNDAGHKVEELAGAAIEDYSAVMALYRSGTCPADLVRKTFVTDIFGNVKIITDARGNSINMSYDAAGRLLKTVDAENHVTVNDYDAFGRLLQTTRLPEGTISNTDLVRKRMVSGQRSTSYVYDKNGNAIYTIDAKGAVVEKLYDANGKVVKEIRYANALTISSIPALNKTSIQKKLVASDQDQIVYYLRNNLGQITHEVSPAGTISIYSYDFQGKLLVQKTYAAKLNIDPYYLPLTADVIDAFLANRLLNSGVLKTQVITFTYNALGELIKKVHSGADAGTLITGYAYTVFGEQASSTVMLSGGNQSTSFLYDNYGQKISTSDALNQSSIYTYDVRGNIKTVTDARGNTTQYSYDRLDRMVRETRAQGYVKNYRYDANGNLESLQAFGYTTAYSYDKNNNKTKENDANDGVLTLDYNKFDEVIRKTDQELYATDIEYDDCGRVITETRTIDKISGDNVTTCYEYDAFGNRHIMVEASGTNEARKTVYDYDHGNRLIQQTHPEREVANAVSIKGFNAELITVDNDALISASDNNLYEVSNKLLEFSGKIYRQYTNDDGNEVRDDISTNLTIKDVDHTVWLVADGMRVKLATISYTRTTASVSRTILGNVTLVTVSGDAEVAEFDLWRDGEKNSTRISQTLAMNDGKAVFLLPASVNSQCFSLVLRDAQGLPVRQLSSFFSDVGTVQNINGIDEVFFNTLKLPKVTFSYDAYGNLASETVRGDATVPDKTTWHYYDQFNRKIYTVDASGAIRRWAYDGAGNVLTDTRFATRYRDTDEGIFSANIDIPVLLAGFTSYEQGFANIVEVLKSTGSKSRSSTFSYDQLNRVLTKNTGTDFIFEHADAVNLGMTDTTADDSSVYQGGYAHLTTQQYDANGNLTRITTPRGALLNRHKYSWYNAFGKVIFSVDETGAAVAYEYDAAGNMLKSIAYEKPVAASTLSSLGGKGDLAEITAMLNQLNSSSARIHQYWYDGLNRIKEDHQLDIVCYTVVDDTPVVDADVLGTRYKYDKKGNLERLTNAAGDATTFTYDGLGHQLTESSAAYTDDIQQLPVLRQVTERTYDKQGNLAVEIHRGNNMLQTDGQIMRYFYDKAGNLLRIEHPEGLVEHKRYDIHGNVVQEIIGQWNNDQTEWQGQTTSYTYDAMNRTVSKGTGNERVQKYVYNAWGDIIERSAVINGIQDLGSVEYFLYDRQGRLVQTNQDDGVEKAYFYDANGNITAKITSTVDENNASHFYECNQNVLARKRTDSEVSREDYVSDAADHQLATYRYGHNTLAKAVESEGVLQWVDVHDSYSDAGGIGIQSRTTGTAVFVNNGYGCTWDMTIPPIDYLGEGDLIVYTSENRHRFPWNKTSIHLSVSVAEIRGAIRLCKEMPNGQLIELGRPFEGFARYEGYNDLVSGTKPFSLNNHIYLSGLFNNAGQISMQLKPENKDYFYNETAGKVVDVDGQVVPGLYKINVSGIPGGVYEYQYNIIDENDSILKVKGSLCIGNDSVAGVRSQLLQTMGDNHSYQFSRNTVNTFGEVIQVSDAEGNFTRYQYDSRGLVIRDIKSSAQYTDEKNGRHDFKATNDYFYDAMGNLVAREDAASNAAVEFEGEGISPWYWTQEYNALNQLIAQHTPEGAETLYAFDLFGNQVMQRTKISETDGKPVYRELVHRYNLLNQVIETTLPTGSLDEFYTDASDKGSLLEARAQQYAYDYAGRRTTTVNALGQRSDVRFDDLGRMLYQRGIDGLLTLYRYQYEVSAGATGQYITTQLQSDGVRSLVDKHNAFGQLREHVDLDHRKITYTYNKSGWLLHQTADKGAIIDTVTDAKGIERPIYGVEKQHLQDISNEYYQTGLLKRVLDRALETETVYDYDDNGRRSRERYIDTAASSASVIQDSVVEFTRYDSLGRMNLFKERAAGDTLTTINYQYDANGNRRMIQSTYPNMRTDAGAQNTPTEKRDDWYRYDKDNRFVITGGERIGENIVRGTKGYEITYNAAGERIMQQYTNAQGADVVETYTYNSAGILLNSVVKITEKALSNHENFSVNLQQSINGAWQDLSLLQWINAKPQGRKFTTYINENIRLDAAGNTIVSKQTRYTGFTLSEPERYRFVTGANKYTDSQNTPVVTLKDETITYIDGRTDNVKQVVNRAETNTKYIYDHLGNLGQTQKTGGIWNSYLYQYWDTAKQWQVTTQGNVKTLGYKPSGYWLPGLALYQYDANGHASAVIDVMYKEGVIKGRRLDYRLDQQGRILARTESVGMQNNNGIFTNIDLIEKSRHTYLYFNGIGVGDFGTGGPAASTQDYATSLAEQEAAQNSQAGYKAQAVTSADFQYNFQPINNITRQTSSYTVQADGETLEQIAIGQWGDGSLWYLIAEVNGFTSKTQALTEGTTLIIPNVNANVHNNSGTFKPYNPTELMGNVQPTLPDAPKPKKDCGAKQILIAVVAVVIAAVVTYFTAGALGGVAMSWAGAMVAGAAGAAGAAAGAVASQLTGVALGTQKLSDFSWNAVRDAGIGGFVSGVVTAGIGNIGWLKTADNAGQAMRMLMAFSRSAISTTISSGVMSAANKGTFSWRDSIVQGTAAALSASDAGSKITGQQLGNPRNIGYHLTSGLLEESVQSLVYSDDFDFAAVARNTVNSYVKQSVENGLQQADHDRQIDDLMQRTGVETRAEAENMMTEYTDRHNGGAQAAEYYAQKNANKYGSVVFNPDMDNLDAAQKYVSDYLPNAGQMSDSVGVDIWADDGEMTDEELALTDSTQGETIREGMSAQDIVAKYHDFGSLSQQEKNELHYILMMQGGEKAQALKQAIQNDPSSLGVLGTRTDAAFAELKAGLPIEVNGVADAYKAPAIKDELGIALDNISETLGKFNSLYQRPGELQIGKATTNDLDHIEDLFPDENLSANTDQPSLERMSAKDLKFSSEGRRCLANAENPNNISYTHVVDGQSQLLGGNGHALVGDELKTYPVNTEIPPLVRENWFSADIGKAEDRVRNMLGDTPVTQYEFDALVDLQYNVKPALLTESKSPGLFKAIAAQDYAGIKANLVYTKADGKSLGGLAIRSVNRQSIFSGIYPKEK